MELGFLTNVFVKEGMSNFSELASWAHENGFKDLEVGPSVPLDKSLYKEVLDRGNIRITAMTYCRNFLSNDKKEADLHIEELKKRIVFAGELGIEKIVTSTGIDKSYIGECYDRADAIRKTPIHSLDTFLQRFEEIFELAKKHKVKIAFENCPLMGNIAISPVMWKEIFDRINNPYIGLAYDPSHLIWQMIDPYKFIEEFKDNIFHVHAKDTEVLRDQLERTGFLTDFSWWKYRIPGNGEINWRKMIDELKRCNYKGTISIEHEDPDYEDSLESVKKGVLLGRDYLSQFIEEEN